MIFFSISIVILSVALVITSRSLSITTKRLNKVETTLNKVVSIVAMAEPEKFALLPPASSGQIDVLATSLDAVPDHHRRDVLEAIVGQNPWLSQEQFNRLLAMVPDHHRSEAVQMFLAQARVDS